MERHEIADALDSLENSGRAAVDAAKRNGADSLRIGDFDRAKASITLAEKLVTFLSRVGELKSEWSRSASLPSSPLVEGQKPSTCGRVFKSVVTPGNLKSNYLRVSEFRHIFPPDVFGSSNKNGEAKQVCLHIAGLPEPVYTDIAKDKMIFRKRGWCAEFYRGQRVKPGDEVVIEQLGPYEYKISVERSEDRRTTQSP